MFREPGNFYYGDTVMLIVECQERHMWHGKRYARV
jgi:hypothetical protein